MTGTADAGTAPQLSPEQARAQLPISPGAIVLLLAVSAFVMILQETIVTVALQQLSVDLGVSASTVQWLVSGFLLTMGVIIPTTGFLLQRLTPRQVFLISMSLFTAGTVVCTVAPGFEVLLLGRIIQAAGTAIIIPLLMTTIMNIVPPERRGSTMGTLSIVIAVAPAVGPTAGGFILETFDWRWMFGLVAPLAVIMLVVGAVFLRLETETSSTPLDVFSVLLSAVAFGGIVYGFSSLEGGEGQGVPPWVPLVVGAVALAFFVHRQLRLQRRDAALLDLRPFTHYQFTVSVVLGALVFMALLGAGAVLLPIYLQTVLGAAADVTGLAVLPGGIALALLGKPVGWLFDRFGPRPLMIPGAVGLTVALWGFALIETESLIPVIGMHVLLMASLAFMMTPLLAAALGVLPSHLYSHGSAILSTLQQVAGAASIAALVTLASIASVSEPAPDETGMRAAFTAAGVIGMLAIVISLFLRGKDAGGSADAPADTAPADDTTPSGSEGLVSAGSTPAGPVAAELTDPEPAEPRSAEPRPADTEPARDVPAYAGPNRARPRIAPAGAHRADGPTLRGQVRSAAGTPRAVITLIDPNGTQRGHVRADEGSFQLAVPGPGTWYVVVSAAGHQPRADRVLIDGQGNGEVLVHDVTLTAHGTTSPTSSDTRPFARPFARTNAPTH